ncbi:MAG: class I SAM-dependent methyltransferase [Bacilli bacterium]|nr:class I SAM-dependent methyltransferase [Bacilli bacterium]
MLLIKDFNDYELIDTSMGYKYERWGNIYLLRPDPQVIWDCGDLYHKYKNQVDAVYYRSSSGGGHWENIRNIPSSWVISYKNLSFHIKQMGFKHTGLFPEQAVNWDFMMDKIKGSNREIRVLNLFAYTGGATIACLSAGAHVTHVDSSRGMVDWCRENVLLNHLEGDKIRYIVDDVIKFVEREIRRGNHYDAIVMDPPSYGRGANKEVWDIEKSPNYLIEICVKLLSDKPLFFLINSYTTGFSSMVLKNLLEVHIPKKYGGVISCGEVGIPSSKDLILPCGIYGRWENEE